MTTKNIAKIEALRADAEMHGDSKMVAICEAALAGDPAALARCGIVAKAAKSAQAASDHKGTRQSAWAVPTRATSQDLEDLGYQSKVRS